MYELLTIKSLHDALSAYVPILQEGHGYFSQNGEDIALFTALYHEKEKGIFVDIGAYHPFKFSNTFMFYLLGWRGVNIDANQDAIHQFNAVRPEDINIRALVSDTSEEMRYFKFAEGAWNTTNVPHAAQLGTRGTPDTKPIGEETIITTPINELLEKYVGTKKFDLLTIDVEGMDKRLFLAINFDKFRPKAICIELGIADWTTEPLKSYIEKIGYEPIVQTWGSMVLIRVRD